MMEQSDFESKINCMLTDDNRDEPEPSLTANGIKFERSGKCLDLSNKISRRYSSVEVKRWLIVDETLITINDVKIHNFNSDGNYLIKWTYRLLDPQDDGEGCLYFYWSGVRAEKGFSPLPGEVEDRPCIRIVQWAEPFLFLSLFEGRMVVHSDGHGCPVHALAGNGTALYHHYGESEHEGRLYSVPCCPCSLRSRTSFVLIDGNGRGLKIWHGKFSSRRKRDSIASFADSLMGESVGPFKIETIKETRELFDDQEAADLDLSLDPGFTPRLFYCTRDFIVGVENIYRSASSRDSVSPYPFLQSHLYTYSNDGAFILDTGALVWLWFRKMEGSDEWEFSLKRTASAYSRRKNYEREYKTAYYEKEPLEFINLFPYWNY